MSEAKHLSIRTKLIAILGPVIIVTLLALGFYTSTEVKKALRSEALERLETNARLVNDILNNFNKDTIQNIDRLSDKFRSMNNGGFEVNPAKMITVGSEPTPLMTMNGSQINLDYKVVDTFSRVEGRSVATIFVKRDKDFIRISTSLKKTDGGRAVGTLLDEKHPAYQRLSTGENYQGIANLFGTWYMTKYTPIKNSSGAIIGAFFVGSDINSGINDFFNYASSVKIGNNGYIYIVQNSASKSHGTVLAHPEKDMIGKNLLELKDASGKPFLKHILDKKEGTQEYSGANKEKDGGTNQNIAIFTTKNQFEWTIIARTSTTELYSSAARIQWILIAGAILCAMILAVIFNISISRFLAPLSATSDTVAKVADGDLRETLDVKTKDEIGKIQEDINKMISNLTGIISQTSETATNLSSSALQLHQTSETMVKNVESSVLKIGSVATASEEMSATSNDIASNCHQAVDSANHANKTAGEGKQIVERTVESMGRIAERVRNSSVTVASLGERSDQIGAIVATIEDIADQTNLLALNAAIEAARAGEMGRGFAVVADEVRALAERTTKATREIGEMIKTIQNETKQAVSAMEEGVREVESGSLEASQSGEALEEILKSIDGVTIQINQIATAAEEQSATTGEISGNIQEISDSFNSTLESANETATAAAGLSNLATELQQLVRRFRT